MDVIGYQVIDGKDKPWSGEAKPLQFTEAREQLMAARKVCAKSWRMVPVSAEPQRTAVISRQMPG